MIAAIVAVDRNWGIGCEDRLLVRLTGDMKFFKEMTTRKKDPAHNTVVVAGRRTYESIPKRPLPDRNHIILSSKAEGMPTGEKTAEYSTLSEFYRWIETYDGEKFDIFIIGGGRIYRELLPLCQKVYVTKIDESFTADTYFPDLDSDNRFLLSEEGESMEENGIRFSFCTYEKREEKQKK